MAFAFNPDDGPARIMRYVEPGAMPGAGLLCVLDKSQNILVINRELFNQLSDVDQKLTLRTQRTSITMAEFSYLNVPAKAAA